MAAIVARLWPYRRGNTVLNERRANMGKSIEVAAWSAALREPDRARWRPLRGYGEIGRELERLSETAGVDVGACGASVRGEPIWRVVIEAEAADAPTVLIVAGLHAMEHVGVFSALEIIERAARRKAPWPRVRLVVIPLANPDGFRSVERDLARGKRRFRRKNANGVDLNRNFAGGLRKRYWLHALAPMFFSPGPAPLSEPESVAVDGACAAYAPCIAISLHAFGDRIYLPYASSSKPPPDAEILQTLARVMADGSGRFQRIDHLGAAIPGFLAPGAEIDGFYCRHEALAFLLEIGRGPRLREPKSWLLPYAWYTASGERLAKDIEATVAAVGAVIPHAQRVEARRRRPAR